MNEDLLKKLEENRTPILLAEIGAYLHDLGKARKEFVEHFAADNACSGCDGHNYFLSIFYDELKLKLKLKNKLSKIKVQICNQEVSFLDFIEMHHKERKNEKDRNDCEVPLLIRLLYASWSGYDGIDSGLDKGYANEKQSRKNTFISTAFGYEPEENKIKVDEVKKLTNVLYKRVYKALRTYQNDNVISKLRKSVIEGSKIYYIKFLGHTCRSANDVTLWDHSYSVASLYKCAFAKNILNCSNDKCAIAKNIVDCSNNPFDPLNFRWKILSINLAVLPIIAKGIKIGDVIGYKEKIDNAFDEIKTLIEFTYPIGNEIYRNTTGIYFLIPDIEIPDSEIKKIRQKILEKLQDIEPELMPEITINPISEIECETQKEISEIKFNCKTQQENIPEDIKQQRSKLEKNLKESLTRLLPVAIQSALKKISYPTSSNRFFLEKFQDKWINSEVCPICRLRPMKENSDGCEYCLERRKSRAKVLFNNQQSTIQQSTIPQSTIWLDEVSDHNDKVALLIGCFILDKWLDGSFIKTMAIKWIDKNKNNKNNNISPTPKNPSPARIRRCWETTQKFINSTVFDHILKEYDYGIDSPFTKLRTKRIQFTINPKPETCVGATCDIDIDGIRLSPVCIDKDQGLFLTTINLQILTTKCKTIEEIVSWMQGKNIKIKKEDSNQWQEAKITSAKPAETRFQDFLPYIKIYDYPDQFMALVPAYDAIDIAKRIVEEYEIQFSKVRDRLPFHLGIIAFHKKTPLYVAMDAGKRLVEAFKTKTKTINATIEDIQVSRFGNFMKNLILKPENCYSSVPLIWNISYSTGDPDKEDEWHPYIRLKGGNPESKNENNPERKNYSFDYTGNEDYVVHVKVLEKNECIEIETSYFTLTYLETAADRFRIDDNLRPLDDIKHVDKLWQDIQKILKKKNLGTSQLYAFWQEVKKREKDYKRDSTWENFVKSSITNILKVSNQENSNLFSNLFQAVKDGLLDFCLNWNLQVRKIKPEKKTGG